MFHPEFGRYIAWVLFSVGAENLVKAACLCNGVGPKPPKKLHAIEKYVSKHLPELCMCRNIRGERKSNLIDGYKLLKDIRNRDVHNYRVPMSPSLQRGRFSNSNRMAWRAIPSPMGL